MKHTSFVAHPAARVTGVGFTSEKNKGPCTLMRTPTEHSDFPVCLFKWIWAVGEAAAPAGRKAWESNLRPPNVRSEQDAFPIMTLEGKKEPNFSLERFTVRSGGKYSSVWWTGCKSESRNHQTPA